MAKFMLSRFNSTCAETGKAIRKGDLMYYDASIKRAYCKDSKRYQDEQSSLDTDHYIQAQENAYYERLNSYMQ